MCIFCFPTNKLYQFLHLPAAYMEPISLYSHQYWIWWVIFICVVLVSEKLHLTIFFFYGDDQGGLIILVESLFEREGKSDGRHDRGQCSKFLFLLLIFFYFPWMLWNQTPKNFCLPIAEITVEKNDDVTVFLPQYSIWDRRKLCKWIFGLFTLAFRVYLGVELWMVCGGGNDMRGC